MQISARRTSGVLAVLMALALTAILIGCGGGGGGSSSGSGGGSGGGGGTGGTVYGTASYTIDWPAQTRSIPGYALSVILTIYIGNTNIVADQKIINRDSTDPYSQTVSFELPVGNYRFVALAAPYADGGGAAIAKTQFLISIAEGENPTVTLSFDTLIAQVFIDNLPSQATVGDEIQLSAHAKDSKGNAILLAPKALDWTLTNGQDNAIVTADGKLTILQPGSITLQVQEIDTGLTASKSVNLIAGTGNGVVVIVN